MRAISSIILSTANFDAARLPVFRVGGRTRQLMVRAMPQARVMRLAIDPRDGAVRLTLPARASARRAIAWVEERRDWIEAELAKLPPANPIAPGSFIPLEGAMVCIDWRDGASRTVRREADQLVVGGPPESLSGRVLRWLKREALTVLTQETQEYAASAQTSVGKVGIGDPRGRWGSCTSSGDIRYSWRLILAPPEVRRATVAHEVAHRLHMDHSAAFHAAVARLYGRNPAAERQWLRTHGPSLHWLGREG